jgi:hypothetical protein
MTTLTLFGNLLKEEDLEKNLNIIKNMTSTLARLSLDGNSMSTSSGETYTEELVKGVIGK